MESRSRFISTENHATAARLGVDVYYVRTWKASILKDTPETWVAVKDLNSTYHHIDIDKQYGLGIMVT